MKETSVCSESLYLQAEQECISAAPSILSHPLCLPADTQELSFSEECLPKVCISALSASHHQPVICLPLQMLCFYS